MNEENKSPCADCEEEIDCLHYSKYKTCEAWRTWFHEQWQKIRKLFGVECVDLTLEREECDNEDS